MIRYFKKAIPLSILATGIIASASIADTFTLRVGSGHPSKPTAYVTNMEKVLAVSYTHLTLPTILLV